MHRRGFTLIELVTVVVILAVSSAVAVPVYISYRDQAQSSAEQQTVAAIRQSIANHHSRELLNGKNTYPTSLDNVPANSEASNGLPFFGTVLSIPINSGWQKGGSALTYVGPTGATYVYDPTRGTFGTPSGDGATTPNGSSYSLAELLAMTPEQLAALSLDEIHALSEEQIAALSYKQFEAIANKLAPEQIPWATPEQIAMETAFDVMKIALEGLDKSKKNCISDAGVAGLAAHACLEGARLNVMINLPGFTDAERRDAFRKQADALRFEGKNLAGEIRQRIDALYV